MPPKFFENIVILCFGRCFSKQNSVLRLKSDILAPPKFLGWLCHCLCDVKLSGKSIQGRIKGYGARSNFYSRAPMTYLMTSSFVKYMFSLIRNILVCFFQ